MEQITKNAFIDALQGAAAVALIWGGYIEKDRVFNDIQRVKDFNPVFNRIVESVTATRVVFRLNDGERSILAYDQKTTGREHYKDGNILIRVQNHADYKPNICIYKIKL